MTSAAPAHLALGPAGHGVRVLAEHLTNAVGAVAVHSWDDAERHDHLHLHLNDRLLQEAAADPHARLERLAGRARLTVTLHDVPQDTDGPGFRRRREAYGRVLAAAQDWAVSSRHEQALVHAHLAPPTEGAVIPLPVLPVADGAGVSGWPQGPTVAVSGFVYPGKGHRDLIRAAACVGPHVAVTVLALGAVAPGHHGLAADLARAARSAGVGFVVTGHLDDRAWAAALRRVDVPVCGHRNVSASGSINDWLATGRRPLVRDGRYAREMEALRPGCHRLYSDGELGDALTAALHCPELTWLAADIDTRPHLEDTAAAYVAWWESR